MGVAIGPAGSAYLCIAPTVIICEVAIGRIGPARSRLGLGLGLG